MPRLQAHLRGPARPGPGRRVLTPQDAPDPTVTADGAPVVATRPAPGPAGERLFDPAYRAFTVGVVAVMTMFAFEGIGVATALPVIAESLDGLADYAWAFNGYLVASLVAMVASGEWNDRAGPRAPMLVGVSLFAAGALLAGAAWSMPVLVVARVIQGIGGGIGIVTVYVIIGRAFPESLRPRAFGLLSTAWVVPAIVGPVIAGALTDYWTWRAVFWLVVPFVIPPLLLLAPRLGRLGGALTDAPPRRGRIRMSVVAAAGLLLVQAGTTSGGAVAAGLTVAGLVLVALAVRILLPRGALRLRRGLPTVVVMRGLLAGAFFAGEAFVPLALQTVRGASTAQAGITLTVGAVAWAVGSQTQGRLYGRVPRQRLVQAGAALVALCLLTMPLSLQEALPFWVAAVSWFAGAAGMGLAYGAISTLTLELSDPADQGANSAALQVSDSVGSILLIGAAGAVYAASLAADTVSAATFTTIWLGSGALAVVGVVVAARIGRPTLDSTSTG